MSSSFYTLEDSMKNFKILTLVCLLSSLQFAFSQTTLEEYNYVTKGYKDDIFKGKTLKHGYHFLELGQWSLYYNENGRTFERKVQFQEFIRTSEQKVCAIVMIYQRTDVNNSYYFCIPDKDSSLIIWELFFQDYAKSFNNDSSLEALFTMTYAAMRLFSHRSIQSSTTTSEDYKYITRGYQDDLVKGKSIKWGYSMVDIGSWWLMYSPLNGASFQRNVAFKGLFKQQEQKFSGILATYTRTDTKFTHDFCIPFTEDNLMWNLVIEELRKTLGNNREALFAMSYNLIRCASYLSKPTQQIQVVPYIVLKQSCDL